jgi:uncharacterized protein
LGARMGDGKSDFSYIGILDFCRAIEFILFHTKIEGVVNITSPVFSNNHDFTNELARALNVSVFLGIPAFILRLVYGKGSDIILKGQKVRPLKLLEAGFIFSQPGLKEILAFELGGKNTKVFKSGV